MAPEPISVERPRHKKNGGRDNLVMRETELGNSATDNLHHVEESLLPGRSLLHQLGVGLDEVQEHAAEGSLEQVTGVTNLSRSHLLTSTTMMMKPAAICQMPAIIHIGDTLMAARAP